MKPPIELRGIAEAKVSVKGEIPKRSLGRLVDSLTDILRPFSEARGLRADQIRLQREEVAIEIAKRARARASIENSKLHAVDPKILIPLIEKGSLEDPDNDDMIERWSSLLASASIGKNVEPRYIQILSELTSRQAVLFDRVMFNKANVTGNPRGFLEDAPLIFDTPRIREELSAFFRNRKSRVSVDSIFELVNNILDHPGCTIRDIIVFEPDDNMYSLDKALIEIQEDEKVDLDLEIIASLGLLKRVTIFYMTKFREEIQIFYYHATELGVAFFKTVDKRASSANSTQYPKSKTVG